MGSTRLPGKPLRLLAGRPMIARVAERVVELGLGDTVVVATDDERVASAVEGTGVRAVVTNVGHASGTDRVAEAASRLEFAGHDIVLNIQGDEPFVSRDAAATALAMVEGGRFPVGTAACRDSAAILHDPAVVKVVRRDDGGAMYFSRAAIPFLRDDGGFALRELLVLRHIGVYAYTREALMKWVALPQSALERVEQLEQLRPLGAGIPIGVGLAAGTPHGGIDTEDDLRRANDAWPPDTTPDASPSHAGQS